jgi:DNA-directed RNA polymerase subunit RPC12/RpoP
MNDLIRQLRLLAQCKHDDLSIGDEAANEIERLQSERDILRLEIERLQKWVSDLQSGMYINCVYCGHRYGPKDKVPTSMADVLKAHVEICPKHPMSKLKADFQRQWDRIQEAMTILANYPAIEIETSEHTVDKFYDICRRAWLALDTARQQKPPMTTVADGDNFIEARPG